MALTRSYPDYDIDFWKAWNRKELNIQMAPINWIGNKDKFETYNHHVNFSAEETSKARETVPCKLGISYGHRENEKFDIYGIDLEPNAPTFFWVHGGYWRTGDRSWSGCFVRNAYSWGVRSVVISYPLAPDVKLKEICNSVCEALAKAMSLLPKSHFTVGGHSAGVQIASSIFHEIPGIKKLNESLIDRVIGAFFISGPYDMRPMMDLTVINKYLQVKSDEVHDFSPIMTVEKIHSEWMKKRNHLRFQIVTGENDPPALKRHAEIYADMLRKKQFTAEHWTSVADDHYTIVENMAEENSNIAKKLKLFLLSTDMQRKKSKI